MLFSSSVHIVFWSSKCPNSLKGTSVIDPSSNSMDQIRKTTMEEGCTREAEDVQDERWRGGFIPILVGVIKLSTLSLWSSHWSLAFQFPSVCVHFPDASFFDKCCGPKKQKSTPENDTSRNLPRTPNNCGSGGMERTGQVQEVLMHL